ncbi:hypothetical protein FKM82_003639 [Ascaphus truei]
MRLISLVSERVLQCSYVELGCDNLVIFFLYLYYNSKLDSVCLFVCLYARSIEISETAPRSTTKLSLDILLQICQHNYFELPM